MSRSRKDGPRGGAHRRVHEASTPRPGNAPGYGSILDKAQKRITHRKERRRAKHLTLSSET